MNPRVALFFWLFAGCLAAHFANIQITNDHFDRISRGQQIFQFGAVPFRDFFDPGWLLTIYSSAAAQALFGPRLLGEVVLTGVFTAAGIALAGVLVYAAGNSRRAAVAAAALLVLAQPRAYDYDKVFFYAAGLFGCWSYADTPDRKGAICLGLTVALAGLYRYDNGIYIAAAALVTLAAIHWDDRRTLGRRLAVGAAACLLACAPAALFVAMHGGLADAVRQAGVYARTERARTVVHEWPRPSIAWQAPLLQIGRPPIEVRWRSDVDDRARAALVQQHQLLNERDAGDRWWEYELPSPTMDVRALVAEPRIERIVGIDRAGPRVPWRHVVRVTRVLPGFATRHNAEVFFYYLLALIPIVALLSILRRAFGGQPLGRCATAWGLAAATLCTLAHVFVLRDPIDARYPAVAVPAVALAAWLLANGSGLSARVRSGFRTAAMVALIGLVAAPAAMLSTWTERLEPLVTFEENESPMTRLFHESRRQWQWLTSSAPYEASLYAYLARCTTPSDRVMVADFQPQVPMLTRRGFAGGMLVFFGTHWTSPGDQERIVRRLRQESVPIVISKVPDPLVRWPAVLDYIEREYEPAGQSTFGEGPDRTFDVRVRRNFDRTATGDRRWHLPCFGT